MLTLQIPSGKPTWFESATISLIETNFIKFTRTDVWLYAIDDEKDNLMEAEDLMK